MAAKQANLHREARQWLQLLESTDTPVLNFDENTTVEEGRKIYSDYHRLGTGEQTSFLGEVKDHIVPVSHCADGIEVTVYKPTECHTNPAILVYFHGGGWVLGSRESVDVMCKTVSSRAGCIIVNVEYRLAPEHKCPVFNQDCIGVTKWVIQNKVVIGGGEKSIIGVGGDSAGGNRFRKHMFQSAEDKIHTSPLKRDTSSFENLPPALIIICECDMLCDDGLLYAEKMKKSGRYVETLMMKGMIHGFYANPGIFKESCATAYKQTVEFIQARTQEQK